MSLPTPVTWPDYSAKKYGTLCQQLFRVLADAEVGGYHYYLHDLRGGWLRAHSVTHIHRHLGYEVFALLDGDIILRTDAEEERVITAGHLMVVPPQLRHTTYRSAANSLHISLRFSTDPPLSPPLPLSVITDDFAIGELQGLLMEADSRRPGWIERAQHRMTLFLSLILATVLPVFPSCQVPLLPSTLAQQVDDYLRLHLTKPIKLQDVAGALDISERSLVRHFKHETNDTVIARLQALRIEAAVALFNDRPDLTVKQVATMVGLWDCTYFIKCFTRVMGMSPRKYRTLQVSHREIDPPA